MLQLIESELASYKVEETMPLNSMLFEETMPLKSVVVV